MTANGGIGVNARPREATHRLRRRKRKPRRVTHIILFVLAGLVFWTGLFVGLRVNPNGGTALVFAAALVVIVNLAWIFVARR